MEPGDGSGDASAGLARKLKKAIKIVAKMNFIFSL